MADIKFKIVKDYVPPADEEISKMMDFDRVSQQINTTTPVSNAFLLKVLLGLGMIGVTFTLLIVGFRTELVTNNNTNKFTKSQIVEWPKPVSQGGLPGVSSAKNWLADRTENRTEPIDEKAQKSVRQSTGAVVSPSVRSAEKATAQHVDKVTDGTQLDQQQDPPLVVPNKFTDAAPDVGFDSLYRYLRESLVYPIASPVDTIEGVVEIMFLVEKDGSVTEPKVMTSLGKPFDEEALRVIRNMPPWKPAMVNETPMPVRKQIAIQFRRKTRN